ncbi:MAG: flagellar basal body rod protein FlgB [Deltaproteobacteria bacterium]
MIEDMFKDTYVLQRALDASWTRNKVISNNIANVDTPGYKKQKVEFESYLADAVENKKIKGTVTNEKHIPVGAGNLNSLKINIREDNSTTMRLDGNNVDIDSEMADLAKNNIMYNALTEKISGTFRNLRTVINEGRK